MPPDPDKKKLRAVKRAVKKAGTKAVRRALKRNLAEDPDGAADAAVDYGNLTSTGFNGLDRDATRKRDGFAGGPACG